MQMHQVWSREDAHALAVTVRAYGTQRGGLADHIEEAIESALRACGAAAPGIAFDDDRDARLSDQLFRARRAGLDGIALRITALRALCAPVGGLDAFDAQTIAFYATAETERPITLALDDDDRELPAFVVSKPLSAILDPDREPENVTAPLSEPEAPSVSLATIVAEAIAMSTPEPQPEPTPEPEPIFTPTEETRASTEPAREPEVDHDRWQPHADALDAARGPQTLAAFERLFAEHYLPLADVIDRGLVAARAAIAAREEFRRTFSRAYSEALPAFALTGKRPRMVLDAFDVASKMGRAHGARTSHVLLVDAMRFDLATRACQRAAEMLEGRASLADRVTLFSSLPSCTPRQLEGLARGVESLRTPYDAREAEPVRDRTRDTIRRVRLGSRDLYKLDLVEATLAASGEEAIDAFDDLVEETAVAIAKHARAQRARTLVLVTGDHGFRFDGGAAKHGGASPEEVIVAAHAFLIGELH